MRRRTDSTDKFATQKLLALRQLSGFVFGGSLFEHRLSPLLPSTGFSLLFLQANAGILTSLGHDHFISRLFRCIQRSKASKNGTAVRLKLGLLEGVGCNVRSESDYFAGTRHPSFKLRGKLLSAQQLHSQIHDNLCFISRTRTSLRSLLLD
jgi:hypothetical protein